MIVRQIRTGGDRNFAYLVGCGESREAIVIDGSFNPDLVFSMAEEAGLVIRHAFSTHGHEDHTNGNFRLAELAHCDVFLYGDRSERGGFSVLDGQIFHVGSMAVQVIHTPGHTPDSMALLAGSALFTGDTLFCGKVGGTATEADAASEYHSLHEKLLVLPDLTVVWPGHDYGVHPSSTIGAERRGNPFLLQPDFGAFLELKRNWAAYKVLHGIV